MFNQYRKELRSSFNNMTAPVYIAFILALTGIFTTVYNLMNRYPTFEYALFQTVFIFLIAVPILTMRTFAEEKSLKTDQLLYSLPVGMTGIVLGKYFALVTVNAISVLIVSFYPLIFSFYGKINFFMTYTNILGYFLLGCALLAIGMFISSLTESVVLSAVVTLGVLIVTYFIDSIALLIPGDAWISLVCFIILAVIIGVVVYIFIKNISISAIAAAFIALGATGVYFIDQELFVGLFPKLLDKLDIFGVLNNFLMGIFDVNALVYLLSAIVIFVFLTIRSMEKKRWS